MWRRQGGERRRHELHVCQHQGWGQEREKEELVICSTAEIGKHEQTLHMHNVLYFQMRGFKFHPASFTSLKYRNALYIHISRVSGISSGSPGGKHIGNVVTKRSSYTHAHTRTRAHTHTHTHAHEEQKNKSQTTSIGRGSELFHVAGSTLYGTPQLYSWFSLPFLYAPLQVTVLCGQRVSGVTNKDIIPCDVLYSRTQRRVTEKAQ